MSARQPDRTGEVPYVADADHRINGSKVIAPGVILYPFRELDLCAGLSLARRMTTTDVSPDSPRAMPEQCIAAQLATARAAIELALARG